MNILSLKKGFLFLILLLTAAVGTGAQNFAPAVTRVIDFKASPVLSDETINKLVEKYRQMPIEDLRNQLSEVKQDQSAAAALKGMPEDWKPFIKNAQEVADPGLWKVANSVLKSTGANYTFVLFLNGTPLAVSDSNSLMLVSTGMLRLTQNEPESLEGVIGHEISHGMLVSRSLVAKLKFNQALREKNWDAADEARTELAEIEIECDLIMAKFRLAEGKRLDSYERVLALLADFEKEHPGDRTVQWHPATPQRVVALKKLEGRNSGQIALVK